MSKEFRYKNIWVMIGIGPFFGLGLYLDRHHFHIDLINLYVAVEF